MKKGNRKYKVAMAGGGTGGHVFPIKSLIEYLDIMPEFANKIGHIFWVGTKHSLEQNICEGLIASPELKNLPPLSFVSIYSGKYRRETYLKSRLKNIRDLFFFGIGIIQSLWYIVWNRIDIVFCKGGYVALPMVIAAWVLRKKIIVHESDTRSGLVNKIASKLAKVTFTGFDNVLPGSYTVGQILSDEIVAKHALKEYPELKSSFENLDKKKPRILVVGGSQGSQRLYQSLIKAIETDKSLQTDVLFFVVLGLLNKDLKPQFEKFDNVIIFDFVSQKEMGILCESCDIALTRAGTTSLAEQKLYDMKLFIVPIAWTHDQYDNAYRYQKTYDDILIDQKDEGFLNKLVIEIKKHRNFKKNLTTKDRLSVIHVAKQKIRKAILEHN